MMKGCRIEAVAPTKEGYKRKAGTKADYYSDADSPKKLLYHA
jgi:hypothetical protein